MRKGVLHLRVHIQNPACVIEIMMNPNSKVSILHLQWDCTRNLAEIVF